MTNTADICLWSVCGVCFFLCLIIVIYNKFFRKTNRIIDVENNTDLFKNKYGIINIYFNEFYKK
jgi:hypothetical protein